MTSEIKALEFNLYSEVISNSYNSILKKYQSIFMEIDSFSQDPLYRNCQTEVYDTTSVKEEFKGIRDDTW